MILSPSKHVGGDTVAKYLCDTCMVAVTPLPSRRPIVKVVNQRVMHLHVSWVCASCLFCVCGSACRVAPFSIDGAPAAQHPFESNPSPPVAQHRVNVCVCVAMCVCLNVGACVSTLVGGVREWLRSVIGRCGIEEHELLRSCENASNRACVTSRCERPFSADVRKNGLPH